MSKYSSGIIVSLLFFLASCTKKNSFTEKNNTPSVTASQQLPPPCKPREDASRTASAARVTASSQSPVVLLLDFDGQQVNNSAWNPGGTMYCPAIPATLLPVSMRNNILQSVAEDYCGFFVKVTMSEQEYQAAPANRRMRCILTQDLGEQFPNAGGIAFISSLTWGDNTPCFVFCDVMQYNQKYIAGAVSHELGHTFGLQHQSRYSTACGLEEEYHTGFGWDALGWAPIMGISYYQNMVTWHKGPSILGCSQVQNDMNVLKSVAGVKADDYGTTLNNSTAALPLTGTKTGILENATDKDAFLKKETNSRRITVTSNGNSDLAVEVYNSNGQLASVHDDTAGPDVNIVLTGKKYIRVRISSTQPYVPAGDGFGGYTIKVNPLSP